MKAEDPDIKKGPHNEIAAYAVDRTLGLNLVPLTVLREVNGQKYTLQLYYPPSENPEILPDSEYKSPRYNDLVLFDYLIYNVDRDVRASRNLLIGADGRLVALDHSRSFFGTDEFDLTFGEEEARRVSKSFKEKLNQANLKKLRKTLEKIHNKEIASDLLGRLQFLIRVVNASPGFDYESNVSPRAVPASFTFPQDLRGRFIFQPKDFPILFMNSKDILTDLASLGSDQDLRESILLSNVLQNWVKTSSDEKLRFLTVILEMDEKMNRQRYLPVTIQQILRQNAQDIPLVVQALHSRRMEDGFASYLEDLIKSRHLDTEVMNEVNRYLASYYEREEMEKRSGKVLALPLAKKSVHNHAPLSCEMVF